MNKAAGMVVHPGVGNRDGTLVNALLWHLGYRDKLDSEESESDEDDDSREFVSSSVFKEGKPSAGLVHRIDKDTSGLIIVAKYSDIHSQMQAQFKNRTVSREYHTYCWGGFDIDHFIIEGNIDRDPRHRQRFSVSTLSGKPSKTEVWVQERYPIASYLKIKLHTGRTHQIRVHLSHKGRPIIGDELYGGTTKIPNLHYPSNKRLAEDVLKRAKRQLLHAKKISFYHPIRKEQIELEVPFPKDFIDVQDIFQH